MTLKRDYQGKKKVIQSICKDLNKGCSVNGAIILSGISKSTIYRWLRDDQRLKDHFEKGKRESELRWVSKLNQIAMDDEQKTSDQIHALKYLLKSRFSDDWGDSIKVELDEKSDSEASIEAILKQIASKKE